MKKCPVLLFRLSGPLQSWGERSKWDYRDTAAFPTKSGIVGLIGCVMGIARTDPRLGELSATLRTAVRADHAGELITDFHTVSAEKILTAEGKKRSGGNTIITHRSYLQDASFLVAVTTVYEDTSASADLLKRIAAAFESPVWVPYLGRKSCVPSVPLLPVYTEAYGSLEEALRKEPAAARADYPLAAEIDSPDGSGYNRTDEWSASSGRTFSSRRVTVISIPAPETEEQEANHVSE